MNIKATISYLDVEGAETQDDEISRVFLLHSTPEMVVVHLETKTKYPQPDAYCSCGFNFTTKNGNYARVRLANLPFAPDDCITTIAESSRYGIHLVLFKDNQQAKLLWES